MTVILHLRVSFGLPPPFCILRIERGRGFGRDLQSKQCAFAIAFTRAATLYFSVFGNID